MVQEDTGCEILSSSQQEWNKEVNTLSANSTKWSNTLKQLVCNLPMNCLSVFNYFVVLALKGLKFQV